MLKWFNRHAPTILTFLAAGGTVVTAGLAAKGAVKAQKRRIDAMLEKPADELGACCEMSLTEIIRVEAPAYIPAIMAGTGTLLCIFGANTLSKKQQASLISAYAMLQQTYNDYRKKVVSFCGPQADHAVQSAIRQEKEDREQDRPPWDERQIFYMDAYGQFFERTMEEVFEAEYCINRNLALRGYVTLNEFLDFLHLDHVAVGDQLGWDRYDGEAFYGYQWIDFIHRYYETDDGMMVCSIDMPFAPHPETPQDGEEFFAE